jgi:hypothetical protein
MDHFVLHPAHLKGHPHDQLAHLIRHRNTFYPGENPARPGQGRDRADALNINERNMLAGSVLERGLRGERQQLAARTLTQHGMLQEAFKRYRAHQPPMRGGTPSSG